MTHMLKPWYKVDAPPPLYILPSFYLVCNRLGAVTIAATESIMRSDNVDGRWAI